MVGIGKWIGVIDTPMIKGTANVTVSDNDGTYDIVVSVPEISNLPDFSVFDIKEDGNCIDGKAKVQIMGGITVDVHAEFEGDNFSGYIKIPFMGQIPISNGRRSE